MSMSSWTDQWFGFAGGNAQGDEGEVLTKPTRTKTNNDNSNNDDSNRNRFDVEHNREMATITYTQTNSMPSDVIDLPFFEDVDEDGEEDDQDLLDTLSSIDLASLDGMGTIIDDASTSTPSPSSADVSSSEKSAETLISDALRDLSMKDREDVTYEVHGVAKDIDENPGFVAEKLQELRTCLDRLKNNYSFLIETKAFQLAEQQDINFVYEKQNCLDFLRADKFRPYDAARRMVRFYSLKLELFGEDKLCQRLSFNDLDKEDWEVLKQGYFQRLPQRDRAGRAVKVLFPAMMKFASYKTMARILLSFNGAERDVETHSKGAVIIIYDHSDGSTNFGAEPWWLSKMMLRIKGAVPQKVCAVHHCYTNQNSLRRSGLQFLLAFSDRETQARVKIHTGTYREIMHALMTYGIPHHLIPISAQGRIDTKHILQMIEMKQNLADYRKSTAAATTTATTTATGPGEKNQNGNGEKGERPLKMLTLPGLHDVLLGKGKPFQQHAGNMRLHMLVDQLLPKYDKLSRTEKTELAADVVRGLQKTTGGRFLTQECGIWIEISDDIAREKVSHLFRARRKAFVKHQKKQRELENKRRQGDEEPEDDDHKGQSINDDDKKKNNKKVQSSVKRKKRT